MQTVSAAVSGVLLPAVVFPSEIRKVVTAETKGLPVVRLGSVWDDSFSEYARVVGIGPAGIAANKQLEKSMSWLQEGDLFTYRIEEVERRSYRTRFGGTGWIVLLTDDREGSLAKAKEVISCHDNIPDTLITTLCLIDGESLPGKIDSFDKMPGSIILIPKNINARSAEAEHLLFMKADSLLRLVFESSPIAVDFADFKTVLNASKIGVAGYGEGIGPNKALIAAEKAVADLQYKGLHLRQSPSALIHICGNNYSLNEAVDSTTHLSRHFDADAPIVYSMGFDESAESYMVTIFAGVG